MKVNLDGKKEHKPEYYYSIIPDALLDEDIKSEIKELYAWFYRHCQGKASKHPRTKKPLGFFAEKMKVHKRTIQRWKVVLINLGWLKEERRFNNSSVIILNKVKEVNK